MRRRPDVSERHARRRAETRRALLDAARGLVEELPWSRISVELVSERAGLTRTAFYKHFPDKRALLLELLAELGSHLEEIPSAWESDGSEQPEELLRQACAALVETFRVHGRLLRALADEATQDEEVAARYAELGARLSAGVAERIALDVAAGRSTLAEPEEAASALVWMNERYLQQRFGRPPLGDPDRAARALAEIWTRAVYGR